ncbi:MAG: 2-amino-4-hydroxy-6-hydroxymethyldihydropteridine diphosphokinase [Nitratiruptor sp.]|nr:2-amino-4-hydroxy-6-hydroxymethyldihydropteridine diphosphokinase [Nitratiruptor sp.]NPA82878.1 2-amino-4-hydroxy-6-hydroxymethyldihydropteridine diphosphokinase [Campylobacterota bacterium]
MRRTIDRERILFFWPTFPARFHAPTRGRIALVGVGGNLGPVLRRFKKLATILASHPRVRLLATAPILRNPPFGYRDQPDFFNTLFLVQTSLPPRRLLHFLLWLERRFKRERPFPNAPRTLDLDIIFYEECHVDEPKLTIPHPHWMERESVIIPLRYLGEIG